MCVHIFPNLLIFQNEKNTENPKITYDTRVVGLFKDTLLKFCILLDKYKIKRIITFLIGFLDYLNLLAKFPLKCSFPLFKK